jgi:hypothetical protein
MPKHSSVALQYRDEEGTPSRLFEPDDLPELERAPVPTSGGWASDLPEADIAVPGEEPDLTLIAHYFRDVRR